MNGIVEKLEPEVASWLKRQRMLGNWALITMIASGFGGLYLTHTYDNSIMWLEPFDLAVAMFCVAFAEALLGCYYLSRAEIPVNTPNVLLTGFIALAGAALSGFILYSAWSIYFTSRDDDAGLALSLIALYIFFKPMQLLFVLYNYKRGVYHRILGKARAEA